ncbi:MAG: WecB/TagA/CpsF family glycosyltransferase [Treponema sp.]|nr:WecB/TagA/CpsF family glycosyltransferase [Treponema sp.]
MDAEDTVIQPETFVLRERLQLLKVPIDIVPPEQVSDIIYELVGSNEGKNIVLLSLWDLLRARSNKEYRAFILSASLVIPISKSLVGGAQFLTGKQAVRYMPFDFVISLLTALEERGLSVYLLGGKPRVLKKTEKNIRQTFPRLHIVGRYAGFFKKQEEGSILEAIRKAAPTLLLVGKGVARKEHWIARNDKLLPRGLRLWCSDIYDIFAEQKKHPTRYVFDHGLEWISYCFENPFRFFRVFLFLYYKFLVLIYWLFKLDKPGSQKPKDLEKSKR